MIKFRLYCDKDAEEKFLNKMVERGYAMEKFILGFYYFKKCMPTEYTYRLDLLRDKSGAERNEYIQLIRETGGEYVQGWGPWVYFRKKGNFELYTDNESKIAFYSQIRRMFLILAIAELMISCGQWNMVFEKLNKIPQKSIYLYTAIFISLVGIAFLYQVYKCTKKIKSLKAEI